MFIFQQLANVSWSYLVRTGEETINQNSVLKAADN